MCHKNFDMVKAMVVVHQTSLVKVNSKLSLPSVNETDHWYASLWERLKAYCTCTSLDIWSFQNQPSSGEVS